MAAHASHRELISVAFVRMATITTTTTPPVAG